MNNNNEYTDNLYPCDPQEVSQFFEHYAIPYRQDHFDFLCKFGGGTTNPERFHRMGLSCSLSTLKDIYQEDTDREAIPKGVAVFANTYFSDFLFIEQLSGAIYREDYNTEGNSCLGEKLWKSIEDFLLEANSNK